MTVLRIPDEERTIADRRQIAEYLAACSIDYESVEIASVPDDMPAEKLLQMFAKQIDELKARGGYVTADVIDVNEQTPGLDAMLAKFSREHWHDEDEVRFVVAGRGLFHIHPTNKPVVSIEVEAGDLIRVPRGTLHWFDLCSERRIRAIRLFQDSAGWTPHYSDSGIDQRFQPVCFGMRVVA
jgi:1,2-dihydroxy-3-keto-5-methylthiopentene dioxygenase